MFAKEHRQPNKTSTKPLTPTVIAEISEKAVQNPAGITQQTRLSMQSLSPNVARRLQRTIGNQAVGLLLSETSPKLEKKTSHQSLSPQESLQRMLVSRGLSSLIDATGSGSEAKKNPSRNEITRDPVSHTSEGHSLVQRLLIDLGPKENLGQDYVSKSRRFKDDQLVESEDGDKTHDHQQPQPPAGKPKSSFFATAVEKEIEGMIRVDLSKANYEKVGLNEPVIFMGHGNTKKKGIKGTAIKTDQAKALQGYTVVKIAESLNNGLPKNYQGMIFLQGCYTASGVKVNLDDGMAQELLKLLKGKFPLISVKGNVGSSHATGNLKGDFFFTGYQKEDQDAASIQIERYQTLYKGYFDLLKDLEGDLEVLRRKEPQFEKSGQLNSARSQLNEKREAQTELLMSNLGLAFGMQGQKEDTGKKEFDEKQEQLKKEVDVLAEAVKELEQAEQLFKQTSGYGEWQTALMKANKPVLFLRKIKDEAEKGRLTFGFEQQFKSL